MEIKERNLRDTPLEMNRLSLLGLPAEMRLHIFRFLVPNKRLITVTRSTFGGLTDRPHGEFIGCKSSLLVLCKQISEECLGILYGENTFKMVLHEKGQLYFTRNITKENARRLRRLILIAGYSFRPHRMLVYPAEPLWEAVLPGLVHLWIVATKPGPPGVQRYPSLSIGWFWWLQRFVGCFRKHLTAKTTVEVDDGEDVEVDEFFQKHLPAGYRRGHEKTTGDWLFGRAPVPVG
ncbi:hypothetical protein FQN57_004133 [Myotisia sp. PD_48]|nr:hypothetical protein FQN57_004133 [Myotisia sp. PD_48]